MTATTVNGKLNSPGATAPANGAMAAVLVNYDDVPVVGFDVTDQTEILATLQIPVNADGTWTAQLTPNASIQLAGGAAQTAWRITESGAGADGTYWIVVPTGGPYWVGTLRTTLVGAQLPSPIANLAVSGALSVAGTLTLDGTVLASPPNDPSKFLGGDGNWHIGGGAVASVNGHTGVVALTSSDVSAIPTAAAGATGGVATLDGSGLLTPAQLPTALIHAMRLDQFAAPAGDVAMGSHKLTGGAPGTAPTDFATVGQIPTSSRDPYTAMLGLVAQPYPLDATNNDNLGATAGCLILALNRPGAGPITNLGLWLQTAGTGPGTASMALFPAAGGAQLAATADMSTQLTSSANDGTYQEAPLTAPYTAADGVDYYVGLFTNLASDAKIGGVYAGLHIPIVKGHDPMLVITGLSAMPASLDLTAAALAAAAYWLVAS